MTYRGVLVHPWQMVAWTCARGGKTTLLVRGKCIRLLVLSVALLGQKGKVSNIIKKSEGRTYIRSQPARENARTLPVPYGLSY